MGGAPIFPSAGPLQQAGDVIHQLKSARAAASASVADFKTVTLQQLAGDTRVVTGEGAPDYDKLNCSQPPQEQEACCHSLRAAPAELQEAKQEALQLQKQLVQALAQLDIARQQLSELHAHRVELQQDASCIQACLTELSQQVSAADLQHAAVAYQLQVLQAAVQSLERQLQKAHRKTKQQRQQLQKAQCKAEQHQQQLQDWTIPTPPKLDVRKHTTRRQLLMWPPSP
jgi:chromosome segregation ATPase